jgi:hypothetical protein
VQGSYVQEQSSHGVGHWLMLTDANFGDGLMFLEILHGQRHPSSGLSVVPIEFLGQRYREVWKSRISVRT